MKYGIIWSSDLNIGCFGSFWVYCTDILEWHLLNAYYTYLVGVVVVKQQVGSLDVTMDIFMFMNVLQHVQLESRAEEEELLGVIPSRYCGTCWGGATARRKSMKGYPLKAMLDELVHRGSESVSCHDFSPCDSPAAGPSASSACCHSVDTPSAGHLLNGPPPWTCSWEGNETTGFRRLTLEKRLNIIHISHSRA